MDDLEIERIIQEMDDRELNEFTARQVYGIYKLAYSNQSRITTLEKRGNKTMGLIGGFGTFVGAVITSIVSFFVNR